MFVVYVFSEMIWERHLLILMEQFIIYLLFICNWHSGFTNLQSWDFYFLHTHHKSQVTRGYFSRNRTEQKRITYTGASRLHSRVFLQMAVLEVPWWSPLRPAGSFLLSIVFESQHSHFPSCKSNLTHRPAILQFFLPWPRLKESYASQLHVK